MIPSAGRDYKVLVIDDSPDIAALVNAYAEKQPIDLVIAQTAEAGLNRLYESRFDSVLMDFHLPNMNGADAVRKLRRWERQLDLPSAAVFAMTDLHDFHCGEQMLMAGCSGLAGKPLSRTQFLAIASRHWTPASIQKQPFLVF